jgi:hypothetical protein
MRKLIDDARNVWRFWSMQLLAFWSAAIGVWPLLSDEQRAGILGLFGVTADQLASVAALVMFLSITAARVTKQDLPQQKGPHA